MQLLVFICLLQSVLLLDSLWSRLLISFIDVLSANHSKVKTELMSALLLPGWFALI